MIQPSYDIVRRIWYKGFKQFAQELRQDKFSEDTDYTSLISACSSWVKDGGMYYVDLFVQDSSRKTFWNESEFGWRNVFLLVEKDAACKELNQLADKIGARIVQSGHGVPSWGGAEGSLVLK